MDSASVQAGAGAAGSEPVEQQKPKSRLLMFRDRLLSPHLKEYHPHAAESRHQRQVSCRDADRLLSVQVTPPFPRAGSGLERIYPLRFLAGCRKSD